MCTALSYKTCFGRNLDYDFSYNETVTLCPRNFPLIFSEYPTLSYHYAILGMAFVQSNYPLYYDAFNEKGLGIAGLNFVNNAFYNVSIKGKTNIASFEFIPFILSKASTVKEAKELLKDLNMTNKAFSPSLPPQSLHWLCADKDESIVIESVKEGLKVYDNPFGVLTNNPSFEKMLFNMNNYRSLSNKNPENVFAPNVNLDLYSRGMGALGLPGDLSSVSRFVKVAFTRQFSVSNDDEESTVNQFFHILHSVEQQKGCTDVKDENYEITIYSS